MWQKQSLGLSKHHIYIHTHGTMNSFGHVSWKPSERGWLSREERIRRWKMSSRRTRGNGPNDFHTMSSHVHEFINLSLPLPGKHKMSQYLLSSKKNPERQENVISEIWNIYYTHTHTHDDGAAMPTEAKVHSEWVGKRGEKKKMINYFMNLSSATHHISVSFSPSLLTVQIRRCFYTEALKKDIVSRFIYSRPSASSGRPRK